MAEQPTFDFGTDPASGEASGVIEHGGLGAPQVEDEPTSRRQGVNVTPSPAMAASAGSEIERWHEVPQALFLSWSDRMQAAYCRDRDLDSAAHESDREFYIERARYYDEVVRCSTT